MSIAGAVASRTPVEISPAKRSNLKSQCMSRMKDWHALFESGAISSEEYEDQKGRIIEDLKKL